MSRTTDLPRTAVLLRDGWVEFLARRPWKLFATLTFQNEVSFASADKRFRAWIASANRRLRGHRWYKKLESITWVRFTEQQSRGVIHFHSVIDDKEELDPVFLVNRWSHRNGLAKVEPIENQRKVLRYITKCCHEEDAVDVGGSWNASELELSPLPPGRLNRFSDPGGGP